MTERVKIVVPGDDPGVGRYMLGRRVGFPMGGGDRFHPLHPDRIVDVAQHVDVLGSSGKRGLEPVSHHGVSRPPAAPISPPRPSATG